MQNSIKKSSLNPNWQNAKKYTPQFKSTVLGTVHPFNSKTWRILLKTMMSSGNKLLLKLSLNGYYRMEKTIHLSSCSNNLSILTKRNNLKKQKLEIIKGGILFNLISKIVTFQDKIRRKITKKIIWTNTVTLMKKIT